MKKTILFIILMLALVSIASSQITLTTEEKLENYADTNFKPEIKYKTMSITSYETDGNLMIIKLNIDGKNIRWITSSKRFNEITK